MVKFGDHWTVNGFGETSIDLEGIVIVLNGSQPLAIGVLWYRTITQVYTACNFFLLTTEMAIFESGEDKEEHSRDKERRKMQKNCDDRSLSQPIVKTRPEYEWFKFASWTYQMIFKNKQWQHNFLYLLLIVYWWKNNNDKRSSWYLWYMSQHAAHLGTIGDVCPIYSKYPGTPAIEQKIKSDTWTRRAQLWTMLFVFTNEEGRIFRTKFRRRKMLARPSSAFMIILISWKFGWEILTIGQTM